MKTEPLKLINFRGGKSGLAHLYPKPQFSRIVEPFAGGAGYALQYPEREVILYEIDPVVFGVWEHLIAASAKDILALPLFQPGEKIDAEFLSQAEKDLIGLWVTGASSRPLKTVSRGWVKKRPEYFWSEKRRAKIAEGVEKIKHWKIFNHPMRWSSFQSETTFFVDPPYQVQGKRCYTKYAVDYYQLWDMARYLAENGNQVILCEGENATWGEFNRLDPDAPRNKSPREIALSKELFIELLPKEEK